MNCIDTCPHKMTMDGFTKKNPKLSRSTTQFSVKFQRGQQIRVIKPHGSSKEYRRLQKNSRESLAVKQIKCFSTRLQ